MGAEAVADIDLSWHGFAGDRRWAFNRNDVSSADGIARQPDSISAQVIPYQGGHHCVPQAMLLTVHNWLPLDVLMVMAPLL